MYCFWFHNIQNFIHIKPYIFALGMYELTMQEKTRQSIILYEYYTCTLFFFITEPQEVRISVNGHRMFHLLVFMDLHYKQYI